MKLCIIVARYAPSIIKETERNIIGFDNNLIFKLAIDMQHFKRTTMDHKNKNHINSVVMGYKTFLSIPKHYLEGRENIILSGNPEHHIDIKNKIESVISKNNQTPIWRIIGSLDELNNEIKNRKNSPEYHNHHR